MTSRTSLPRQEVFKSSNAKTNWTGEKDLRMIQSLANLVAIVVVGLIVLLRGRDRRVGAVSSARWLRLAAVVPLLLQLGFFLMFAIGEMTSGDLSGAGHLVQAAVVALLGILAWMRPLEGGAALIVVAALMIIGYKTGLDPSRPVASVLSPMITILAAPQLISGVLFFIAGILGRRTATPS
jgi:hypothetical protein